jgi:hypothetical protein
MAEPGDSLLLKQNLQKSETIGYPEDKADPIENRNQSESEEYVVRQWYELDQNIKAEEKKIQNVFREATNAQFKASELLENAEADKTLIESDHLAALHEEYEESVRNLRMAKSNQKAIKNISDESKNLANQSPQNIEKKLPRLRSKFESFMNEYDPGYVLPTGSNSSSSKKDDSAVLFIPTEDHEQSTSNQTSTSTSSKSDNINLPPHQLPIPYKSEPFNCIILRDTLDEVTGKRRIVLEPGLLFTHTDPDLRPYFKNKELITCNGQLFRIDSYVYFNIDFQIASSHSQGNFGSLEKGSLLRFRLLDGNYVTLYDLKSDDGRIDPYTGNTVFSGQYAIGKNEIKMLQSSSLDKMRILWRTGYEDYDVYKIDFFIDRLECLMNK